MKSLADLKSSPDVGLPEREVTVCVSAKLARELEEADRALFAADEALRTARQEAKARADGDLPPLRSGQKSPVAAAEKEAEARAAESDAIRERIKDASVTLLLRGKTGGEWRQWASKHPAREEGEPGAEFDRTWAVGFCNLDALIADLPSFVASYNGEPASDEWAQFVSANGVPAHLRNAASAVVAMHEQGVDVGKDRRSWLAARMSAPDSN